VDEGAHRAGHRKPIRGREGAIMEKEDSRKNQPSGSRKQQMKIRRSFIQRDLPCKRTGNFNERLTDAEIMRAIRYLDRDVCAERTGEDAGTILGFFITFVAVLIGALAYSPPGATGQ